MKIYTRTGDGGSTALNDGNRCSKDTVFFDTLGEMDELSSRIGMLCSLPNSIGSLTFLRKIQRQIHCFSAHVASPTKTEGRYLPAIDQTIVDEMEREIDRMDETLPALSHFILPGHYQLDAQTHLCRTQARKVERALVRLTNHDEAVTLTTKDTLRVFVPIESLKLDPLILKYFNRLSDYFFVLARWLCYVHGGVEYEVK